MTTRSTAQSVADTLRELILRGELRGGEPLKQAELARRTGISRIPLREALLILEAEGLVRLNLNRTATVTALSAADAREIYIMRIALETAALREALPRLTPADFARASGVLGEIDHAHDAARWSELNWEFHRALYTPAGLPRLLGAVKQLHANVSRYFPVLAQARYRARSQKDHRELLRACKARDEGRAVALLTSQLQLSAETLVAHLSALNPQENP